MGINVILPVMSRVFLSYAREDGELSAERKIVRTNTGNPMDCETLVDFAEPRSIIL
jgi:hypothetical protein